jgi:hypothetical protein
MEQPERREHTPIGTLADQLKGIGQRMSEREAAKKSDDASS